MTAMTVTGVLGAAALASALPATAASTLPAPTQVSSAPVPTLHGHWVGRTQQLVLSAVVTSPTPSVRGDFLLRDATSAQVIFRGSTGYVSGSGRVSVDLSTAVVPLVDGHRYAWKVRADDGVDTSGWVTGQAFSYDGQAPTMPTVASSDFPASDGTTPPTHHVGQSGTVDLAAQDPSSPSGVSSGLARIDWQLGSSFSAGGAPQPGPDRGSIRSSSGTITITPSHWGTNVLYVRSIDTSGNVSQNTMYSFYVLS